MPNEVSIDKGVFRVKDWWWSKAALLMGMVYLFTVWFGISFWKFIPLALLSLCTIIGFASAGYLLNDLFDRKHDTMAGKKNFLIGKSPVFILLLFLLSLAFIFLPWIFLPADRFSFSLIGFQLLLFLIYSVPPMRLKERGIAGIIVDSLYAHAVPPILAAYTFSLAAGKLLPGPELVFLFAWQFAGGVRNILMHQSEDIYADQKSGSRNFASSFSATGFIFSVKYLIIVELGFGLSFFALISAANHLFLVCVLCIAGISGMAIRLFYKKGIQKMLESTWRFFPNNIYEKWLPALFLILGVFSDRLFIIILLVHLALFNFNLYWQVAKRINLAVQWIYHNGFNPLRNIISIAGSAIVNYSIYYSLILFGVDLKKENTSALNYFRKKFGKK